MQQRNVYDTHFSRYPGDERRMPLRVRGCRRSTPTNKIVQVKAGVQGEGTTQAKAQAQAQDFNSTSPRHKYTNLASLST